MKYKCVYICAEQYKESQEWAVNIQTGKVAQREVGADILVVAGGETGRRRGKQGGELSMVDEDEK